MANVLITIINLSIAAVPVILIALTIRFFLKTVSKKYSYILWGIVYFRLILPFGISFQSLLNLLQGQRVDSFISRTEFIPQSIGAIFQQPGVDTANTSFSMLVLTFFFTIWILGFLGIATYEIVAYIKAGKGLAAAIKIRDRVYETDQVTTPLIFGVRHPKIYVPVGLTAKELNYILCHEFIHVKRKDYLFNLLGCFLLALHWFNPFVWVAFKYMSIDMEMSCDEKVIDELGDAKRKEYAEMLFHFSDTKIKATRSMLTFGASNTRVRIKNLLRKRRNTIIIIPAVIVIGVLAIGLLSNFTFGSLFGLIRDQARSDEIERLATTDLSGISIDGIQISTDIDYVDLSIYQQSNRFSVGNYAYYFDRLVLDVDENNRVRHIFGYNSEVTININNHTAATIDDITKLLGDNYLDENEDSEQKLKKHVYYDSYADVVAEFIYSDYDQQFVWIILRKNQ